MSTQSALAIVVIALATVTSAAAQSPADLLQKGIYAQETSGDLDSAIKIFRQVANSPNKSIAAQAQYQLVLCMLQRGDPAAASREVETLARNFADQTELVTKARNLLPGGGAILPAPWGDGETSQLNIKRDGIATLDHLTYSIDPAREPDSGGIVIGPDRRGMLIPNQQSLRWELVTAKSRRSVLVNVDRNTGQPVGQPVLASNDITGDAAVVTPKAETREKGHNGAKTCPTNFSRIKEKRK
jgi:Tetratricopeptide repeat